MLTVRLYEEEQVGVGQAPLHEDDVRLELRLQLDGLGLDVPDHEQLVTRALREQIYI